MATGYWWPALIAALSLLIAVIVAIRIRRIYRQRARYATYWRDHNDLTTPADAIHLVTLGDSLMQGIGASSPEHGLGGLAAAYVAERTGRAVRLTNLSRSGAKVSEVVADQLPTARLETADIVLVTVSANDAMRQVPLAEYRANLDELFRRLPADRTVVSDVALVRGRRRYQPVLAEVAGTHGISRADVTGTFANARNPRNLAGDFFHPNDRGYRLWLAAFEPELRALLGRIDAASSGATPNPLCA